MTAVLKHYVTYYTWIYQQTLNLTYLPSNIDVISIASIDRTQRYARGARAWSRGRARSNVVIDFFWYAPLLVSTSGIRICIDIFY